VYHWQLLACLVGSLLLHVTAMPVWHDCAMTMPCLALTSLAWWCDIR